MCKGINKLAKLIKLMAKDVSNDSLCKYEHIGPVLGLYETDAFFDELAAAHS